MSGGEAAPARGATEGAAEVTGAGREVDKSRLLLTVVGVTLALDLFTKALITTNFALYQSVPVLGDFFRLTYTHNPGAAFGINIGDGSRIFFLVLALVALGVLAYLYRVTPAWDRLRLFALSLVAGGAIGNIVDRIRYERGVVDFLDFGIGQIRWPVFNVADMAVSIGAALLLISFYLEEKRERTRPEPEG